MKIKPLNDRVLVIRTEDEKKTKGGIIIPDTAKEKPQKGRVVAVGPGKMGEDGKRLPMVITLFFQNMPLAKLKLMISNIYL